MSFYLALLGQRTVGRLCLSVGLIPRIVFVYLQVFAVLSGMTNKNSTSAKVVTNSIAVACVLPLVVACRLFGV